VTGWEADAGTGGVSDIKEQVYRDPRPAEAMAPYHEWARTHEPGRTYTAVRVLLTPVVVALYRTRAIGRANVPARGGLILAPNHFSNMDHFFCGVYLRRQVRFMSKSQFFGGNPLISYVFRTCGHFPVRRGHRDDEAFITAQRILARGGCVGIYAEGGRSRSGGLGELRPGVGRVALESGVPVVPVAIHGSLAVRDWRRGRFPRITVSYGEPLVLTPNPEPDREQQMAAAQQIFARVRALYAARQ